MTSHQDRRLDRPSTSRDYELEAENARRRLADNLDELSDRLTPGQVFDEMLTYSRAGGGTFYRALTNAMRENPVPSLLIGAGCMMFLSEKMGFRPGSLGNGAGRRSAARADALYGGAPGAGDVARAADRLSEAPGRVSDAAGRMVNSTASSARNAAASVQGAVRRTSQTAADQLSNAAGAASGAMTQTAGVVGDTLSGMTGAVSDTVQKTTASMTDKLSNAADAVRSTTHDVRDQAAGAADHVRRGALGAVGSLRDTASSVSGRLADTAGRTGRGAFDAVRSGRETATSFIAEQPLLSAAIGVAIGAAIATLLPRTETEDEWMGEASDRVKSAAGEAASKGFDSAKAVASKVAERAQSAAQEEGLTPSAAGEAPRSAAAESAREFGQGIQPAVADLPMSGSAPQELSEVEPIPATPIQPTGL